ncbi:MAG: pantothenate kinase [Bacteroidia bacterium]|nr:MAG: pantothenate kinase [Bacteroidia bacterium]
MERDGRALHGAEGDYRLVVDAGNSSTKLGIYAGRRQVLTTRCTEGLADRVERLLAEYPVARAIISSVAQREEELRALLGASIPVHVLSHRSTLPFRVGYSTPETLGRDRLAAMAGAAFEFEACPLLVVDLGTAITYDFLDAAGVYHGGAISPGIGLRLASLHEHTARLPLVERGEDSPLVGGSTADCLRSGAVWGVVAEVEFYHRKLAEQHGELKLILCGGDADFLHRRLFYCNFVRPNLVLDGLNRLTECNA